jgi:hypothetical protein
MSTTTNFKRIALVAVAALGMGVLSSVPSQAAFSGTAGSQLTITVANGTGSLSGSASDSTTAGTVTVSGLALANTDSFTVDATIKSVPATTSVANAPDLLFAFVDTSGSTGKVLSSGEDTAAGLFYDSDVTTTESKSIVRAGQVAASGTANAYVAAKWYAFQDSQTAKERVAGTYTYTLIITPLTSSGAGTAQTADITITIAALSSASLTASASGSTAYIGTSTGNTADASVSVLATVSATDTPRGYITVVLKNAAGSTNARESVTITTTAGTVGDGTNRGRSVVLKYNSTSEDYKIYSDGTAGTATITISTPSVTFASKTVNFYAAAPKTLTTTVLNDTLKVGSNTAAIGVKAVDANGLAWTGTLYVYSDTVGTVSNDASSCSYDATDARHECSLTGVTAGTAKITVRDAATVAASTVSATAVTVTVSTAAIAKFTMAFDKATYAPGEKATLVVTAVDSTGKAVAANEFANLFTSTGITLSTAAGNGSDSVFSTPSASVTTASLASSSSLYTTTTPVKTYTIYMPTNGGKFEASATGGASLPVAGQVKVTATATITDNAAAALAAVNELATTVASLKTLITTLTNLVLKIQKKVKA